MKKTMLLSLCTLLVSLSGCKGKEIYKDKSQFYVNVSDEEITLLKGESKKVSATTNYEEDINFASSNEKIASVTQEGVITGIRYGTCIIYAYVDFNYDSTITKEDDIYKEIKVTVTADAQISLQKNVKLYVGDTIPNKDELPKGEALDYNINDVLIGKDLTIYNVNIEGDVPYVEVKDIPTIAKYITNPNYDEFYNELPPEAKSELDNSLVLSTVEENSLYKFELFNQNVTSLSVPFEKSYAPLYIDIKNSKVYTNSYSKYMSYINSSWNNNLPNDYANIGGIVSDSELTKYITQPAEQVTFDFAEYAIYFYTINGKSYVPLNSLSPFISENVSFYYNGSDSIINLGALGRDATYYFYTSDEVILHPRDSQGCKLVKNDTLSTSGKKAYTESYFLGREQNQDVYLNTILLFDSATHKYAYRQLYATQKNNFTFDTLFSDPTPGNEYQIKDSYQGIYEEDDNNIRLMRPNEDSDNQEYILDFYVSKKKSNFGKNLFGNNVKSFNMNYLIFYLDTFYGLKDYQNISSFEELFKTTDALLYLGDMNHKKNDSIYNHLVNASTPNEYAYVLEYIFSKMLGDGHSGMSSMNPLSSINNLEISNAAVNSQRLIKLELDFLSYGILRMENLGDTIAQVQAKVFPTTEHALYFEDETAILQFDSFIGNQKTIEDLHQLNELFDTAIANEGDNSPLFYSQLAEYDTFAAFLFAFKLIKQKSNIKNIVFDITINGGGYVLTIPQILAFMTDDPLMIERDTIEKSIIEYHYKVDLDGNGTYGDSNDTYKGKYNFYVLTSNYSFSCGSLLPASCKTLGCAKIIGLKSGGGACPVHYGSDVAGSLFQISGPSQTMYKLNDKYVCNDSGVELDYELDTSYWYDHNKLNTFLKSLHS